MGVFSYKEMCLAQQGKVIGVMLCSIFHLQLSVYGIMI